MLNYGQGGAVVQGRFGGSAGTDLVIRADRMPLSLIDIAYADVGLGGTASGVVEFQNGAERPAVARA